MRSGWVETSPTGGPAKYRLTLDDPRETRYQEDVVHDVHVIHVPFLSSLQMAYICMDV